MPILSWAESDPLEQYKRALWIALSATTRLQARVLLRRELEQLNDVGDREGETPVGVRWESDDEVACQASAAPGSAYRCRHTAQWCLTCLVNERVALKNPAVRSGFQEAGVATLRADWTDTNEEIARALGSFGRASVPLYVFYPRGGGRPVILPEILTPGIVLDAIAASSRLWPSASQPAAAPRAP